MASENTIKISREEYDKFLAMNSEIESLKHQLDELKRMIFGAKRERFVPTHSNQGSLFDLPDQQVKDEPKEEITYTRNKPSTKNQPLRLELAPHLPRRQETIEPEGA